MTVDRMTVTRTAMSDRNTVSRVAMPEYGVSEKAI